MCVCVLQVALDIIEELCYEMCLERLEAMDEYTIFLVTNRGTHTPHTHTMHHTHTIHTTHTMCDAPYVCGQVGTCVP